MVRAGGHQLSDGPVDRHAARIAFERAARTYDEAAVLQREVSERLLERLELTAIQPKQVMDLGCGTGFALPALQKTYPEAHIVEVDIAESMLKMSQKRTESWVGVCADVEQLPFTDGCCDLIYSNLVLQWCPDPEQAFREASRTLRDRSLYLFTTLGPDTLFELREAWSAVDDSPHVNPFYDMHDLGDSLIRAGFVEPVMDVENFRVTYRDVADLIRDLRSIGARNANSDRSRKPIGKAGRKTLFEAYEPFRGSDGLLSATYEVIYGTAWTPVKLKSRKEAG